MCTFRSVLLALVASCLCGCMTEQSSFTAPSGATVSKAKCSASPNGCFQEASKTCSGPYQVIDSESHAGGALADLVPGPVTWYSMTYQCGPSNGQMPTFAFRGAPVVVRPVVFQQALPPPLQAPSTINCTTTNLGGGMANTSCH